MSVLIAKLSGNSGNGNIPDEKVIICADDLAPSETVAFDKDKVLAFVTAYGSSNSHTAILARSMNTPEKSPSTLSSMAKFNV